MADPRGAHPFFRFDIQLLQNIAKLKVGAASYGKSGSATEMVSFSMVFMIIIINTPNEEWNVTNKPNFITVHGWFLTEVSQEKLMN